MTRLSCLVLFCSAAFAAPIPKDAGKATLYYPSTAGSTWVYEDFMGEEEAVQASSVEKDGSTLVFTRVGIRGNSSTYTRMMVTSEGLRALQVHGKMRALWLLKTKVGESWEEEDGKRTVYAAEEVKVPAGTFEALKVVREFDAATYTSWYAPNVGEVKQTLKRNGIVTVTRSLKSFSEGRK